MRTGSLPGGKVKGAWCWPSTQYNAEVQERVEVYHNSPSGPPRPVLQYILFLTVIYNIVTILRISKVVKTEEKKNALNPISVPFSSRTLAWNLFRSDICPRVTRDRHLFVFKSVLRKWKHILINAIPWQTWTGPEGSRRLRLPDFKTIGTWRW